MRQKTAEFYFCNNFVKIFLYWNSYWYTYTIINLEQNDVKIISLLWSVSLYCLVKCNTCTRYDQRRFCHVSLNITIIVLTFKWNMKMYVQQRSALVQHIKCFRCLSLSLSYVLCVNCNLSIIWSMTICWMLDQPSPRGRLNSINISHRILIDSLLQHCRDSVIYAIKSGMLGSHGLGTTIPASRDKAVRWLCVHGALYF